MTEGNQRFDRSKLEPHTVREKDSICPFIGDVCPKDPKLCGRYQPMNVIDNVLGVQKTVYMCVDDAIRMTDESILTLLQAICQAGNVPSQGQQGGPTLYKG